MISPSALTGAQLGLCRLLCSFCRCCTGDKRASERCLSSGALLPMYDSQLIHTYWCWISNTCTRCLVLLVRGSNNVLASSTTDVLSVEQSGDTTCKFCKLLLGSLITNWRQFTRGSGSFSVHLQFCVHCEFAKVTTFLIMLRQYVLLISWDAQCTWWLKDALIKYFEKMYQFNECKCFNISANFYEHLLGSMVLPTNIWSFTFCKRISAYGSVAAMSA